MKILELTNYSAGICGVWQRAKEESIRLSKLGYEVKVFSSNLTKGSNKIAPKTENISKIKIIRFPAKKIGGESFMKWFNKDAKREAINFSPDIIIAHSYRHPHTHSAIKIKEKLKSKGKDCKTFLVTHAPFIKKDITRSPLSKIAVRFYDKFIAKKILKKFTKIITISKWEIYYIIKLGIKRNKIIYIPNGIPQEFFNTKKLSKEENKILFLGRISPIKNLEVIIKTIPLLKNKETILEIVGPSEKRYLKKIKSLIKKLKIENRVIFSGPIYGKNEKMKKIDSAKIFILPSIRESMPQSLIETMARNKIVIATSCNGTKEIIKNGKNGILFELNNIKELSKKINTISKFKIKNIRKSVEQFSWNKIIEKMNKLFITNYK